MNDPQTKTDAELDMIPCRGCGQKPELNFQGFNNIRVVCGCQNGASEFRGVEVESIRDKWNLRHQINESTRKEFRKARLSYSQDNVDGLLIELRMRMNIHREHAADHLHGDIHKAVATSILEVIGAIELAFGKVVVK